MSSRCAGLLYLQSEQSIAPLLKACELFGVEDRKSLPLCAIRTHLLCDKNCPAANDCNPCVSIFSPLKRAWAFTHSQLSRGSYTLTSKHTHTHADIFPFLSFFLFFCFDVSMFLKPNPPQHSVQDASCRDGGGME